MAAFSLQTRADFTPEYAVYVYHRDDDIKPGYEVWEKLCVFDDVSAALSRAKDLHVLDIYKKIEIKETYYDPKYARSVARVFKVLDAGEPAMRALSLPVSMAVCTVAGLVALAVAL